MSSFRRAWFGLAFLSLVASASAQVPTPKEHLGYEPGADYRLVMWQSVVDYFQKVDAASNRVVVRKLGDTTEKRPYIAAFISSEANIADLDKHRARQHQVADPRLGGDPTGSKPVVLITCSIHSSETASTLMAIELLHQLATGNDPATKEILDNTILILVPSANPDGVDIVARWYEQTKGHPWEGSGLPELYHRVAGHDTNRDWFMLNLEETKILTQLLYHEWFPTITYDVHQMGSKGARMFVPPFFDPINPNLDPRVSQSIFLIGSHMALDLATAGKRGVLTNAMYDNWWNGGNRTTPQRHNMVGVLTEAASVRLATPIFIEQSELSGATRGFPNHKPTVNFVDPWPGGWWRLRDIVEYELICSKSVLTLAARYRNEFQTNYVTMGRDAIAKGKNEPPYGWVVPIDQRDTGSAALMVRTLVATGIEAYQLEQPTVIEGNTYAAGSWVLPTAQPYRAHLKDMMERQDYPTRYGPDGNAEPPYDVAGWTLPLKMGVRAVTLTKPITPQGKPVQSVVVPGSITLAKGKSSEADGDVFRFTAHSNDAVRLTNALLDAKVELMRPRPAQKSGPNLEAPTIELAATAANKAVLDRLLTKFSVNVVRDAAAGSAKPVRPQRVGLYHPHVPSMDEGWTRFVLEQHGFAPVSITNGIVKSGRLKSRIDVLVMPSIPADVLRKGYGPDQTAPEFVGGLGPDAVVALRDFVNAGGKLICLDHSCEFAIQEFGLPITNVVKGLRGSEFYCPGSILRATRTRVSSSRIPDPTDGLPAEFPIYFDRSLAFEAKPEIFQSHLNYASVNPLESGWLLGAQKIQGKSALGSVGVGAGTIVLFGFPPQHRGQTHGTFLLLFNAILQDTL